MHVQNTIHTQNSLEYHFNYVLAYERQLAFSTGFPGQDHDHVYLHQLHFSFSHGYISVHKRNIVQKPGL